MVDDGSDDNTSAMVEEFKNLVSRVPITLVRQKNQGVGKARNTGVNIAVGNFIAFLDADDEWLPNKVERSLDHMSRGQFSFIAHDGWVVNGRSKTRNSCAKLFETGGGSFQSLYRKGYIDTSTVVARRQAIITVGGFDPGLSNAQDFDLWLALASLPDSSFLVFGEICPNTTLYREVSCRVLRIV